MIRSCVRYSKNVTGKDVADALKKTCSGVAEQLHECEYDGFYGLHALAGREWLSAVVRPDRKICLEMSDDLDRVKWLDAVSMYTAEDSGFLFQAEPVVYGERTSRLLRNIRSGASVPSLPVVVVAASGNMVFPADPWALSAALFGQAYVVAVFSPDDVDRLVPSVGRGGAVAVYGRGPYFQYAAEETADDGFAARLAARLSLSSFDGGYPSSWDELVQAKLQSMEEAQVSVKAAPEDDVDALMQELQEMEEKVSGLEEKLLDRELDLQSVCAERDSLRLASSACPDAILKRGVEQDYYTNEVRETVLAVLEEASSRSSGRKKDLIDDILRANPSDGTRKQMRNELQELLGTYAGPEPRILNSLKRLGFEIHKGGKHIRLCWHGDDRYHGTLSVSPSDQRAGRCAFGQLQKVMFGV